MPPFWWVFLKGKNQCLKNNSCFCLSLKTACHTQCQLNAITDSLTPVWRLKNCRILSSGDVTAAVARPHGGSVPWVTSVESVLSLTSSWSPRPLQRGCNTSQEQRTRHTGKLVNSVLLSLFWWCYFCCCNCLLCWGFVCLRACGLLLVVVLFFVLLLFCLSLRLSICLNFIYSMCVLVCRRLENVYRKCVHV